MTSLNPVHTIGRAAARGGAAARERHQAGRQPAGAGDAEGGRHPPRRDADGRLPAPVLGRHAPARDDRDGADQQPRPADRRRADHGARRDHAGPDPEADERAAARLRQRRSSWSRTTSAWSPRRPTRCSSCTRPSRPSRAPYEEIFYQPEHPYTWGLLGSLPRLAADGRGAEPIPGTPPSLLQPAARAAASTCAAAMRWTSCRRRCPS